MKRIYKKTNRKYWMFRKINKYSLNIWMFIAFLMTIFVIISLVDYHLKSQPLLNPLMDIVEPVEAKEPEVKVSCENPKGYLECQVYQGKITWEEYEKIYKIIECESGWNPEAINTKNKNGTYDRGLFQSNSIHIKTLSNENAFNFKKNIDWGINLFKRQGTSPWNSSKTCWNY